MSPAKECAQVLSGQLSILLTMGGLVLAAQAIIVAFSEGSRFGYNLRTGLFPFAAFLASAISLISIGAGGLLIQMVWCRGAIAGFFSGAGLWAGTVVTPIAAWWIALALKK